MPYPDPPVRLMRPFHSQVNVTPSPLTSNGRCRGASLQAICPSGATIYVGIDETVGSGTGWPMSHGDTLAVEVDDTTEIWAVATADGQYLAILPHRR